MSVVSVTQFVVHCHSSLRKLKKKRRSASGVIDAHICPSLLALTPPLSTPRDSATSAAVRTWSQDPPPRHHRVTVRRRIAIARKAPL